MTKNTAAATITAGHGVLNAPKISATAIPAHAHGSVSPYMKLSSTAPTTSCGIVAPTLRP